MPARLGQIIAVPRTDYVQGVAKRGLAFRRAERPMARERAELQARAAHLESAVAAAATLSREREVDARGAAATVAQQCERLRALTRAELATTRQSCLISAARFELNVNFNTALNILSPRQAIFVLAVAALEITGLTSA